LHQRIEQIRSRMRDAARRCGRDPESIRLVAVSKKVSAERVRQAIAEGIHVFGENYVQEARGKIDRLSGLGVSWHFIGHLQSNKARQAVALFDLIHSVDSLKLAHALNREAAKANKVQPVLMQVNIGRETTKSGVSASEANRLAREIGSLENLALQGLMAMPPYSDDPEKTRPYFTALKDLRDRLQGGLDSDLKNKIHLQELSMGMTADFEVAIECGATIIRVGTALFGARD